MSNISELRLGFESAFVDGNVASSLTYKSQFLTNDFKVGKKVLSSIEDELLACDEFQMSVAFITMGGITPLLQTLKELELKNIPGKVLTTNYLDFSEPEALDKLNSFKNITVKMYDVGAAKEGFHTKGYIFKKEEIYRIIIGSSNITKAALTTSREWNTKIVSAEQGEIAKDIVDEFNGLWNSEFALCYDEFIDLYRERYKIIKKQRKVALADEVPSLEKYRLKPNKMQTNFIKNLRNIISGNEDKALLISATGTGKTYASAFAMREFGYKRVLFLVHRNHLAKQTLKAYDRVFDKSASMGLVGNGLLEYDKDFVFATVQTMSRDEHLYKFDPEDFDCIILDEAHHSSAESYQKIIKYFKPKFWLGMTATPDKRDDNIDGRNIYEIFNYQIAYEIRLQQAMEEDLLCTFHYFGITDLNTINDEGVTKEEKLENFRYLTSEERVNYIIEQANFYGHSGERLKGLIFCSRVDEAKKLSEQFNEKGLKTVALSGNDDEKTRENAIELLTKDIDTDVYTINEYGIKQYPGEYLDYIITVDIFSEGTDIVEVNQVLMLRPTQSPIVFVQQLGRGLRKSYDKEYVVVIDFIGNYKNNFMIPIALSGDRTYNKDNVRRYLMEGGRVIPGASTIHFDEVSRKRIFKAIDDANFSDVKLIKENYTNLKNKLGRIPRLIDFDDYGEMDVLRIFDNSSLGSYYKFLVKNEKSYTIRLSDEEEKVIEFISKKLAAGKRIHELEMLNRMLIYANKLKELSVIESLKQVLKNDYQKEISEKQEKNIINVMTNAFPSGGNKQTYDKCVFIEPCEDGTYKVTKEFAKMLSNPDFYSVLKELVEFGIHRFNRDYSNTYKNTDLVLYQKYTYEDVCRLLNWEINEVPLNIGGYKFDKKTNTLPVFINYDKSENISDTTKYEDHFVDNKKLVAISKSGRNLMSDDVQNFIKADERGIRVELFVRKNKDDKISKEFYYLGQMHFTGDSKEFVMANTDKTAVEINWELEQPVREDLYEYIINN